MSNKLLYICEAKHKNHKTMKKTTIDKIKKGSFFTFKEEGRLYVRGEYVRAAKAYEYWPYDDSNNTHFAKKGRTVFE